VARFWCDQRKSPVNHTSRERTSRTPAVVVAALLGVLALVGLLWAGTSNSTPATTPVDTPTATPAATPTGTPTATPTGTAAPHNAGARSAALAPSQATSNLPTITVAKLPPQAIDTLQLINSGGPFPYERDGVTFQNREGLLPKEPQGYYREYTVITPGSRDRGARRVVAGGDGERFYTDDHYDSFREVVQ